MFEKIKKMSQVARAALTSGLLGTNLATLPLMHRPGHALAFLQYQLFGWRMLKGAGLPLQQFHKLFDTPEHLPVELLPTAGDYLRKWDATYTKDMLYLALLAKVLSPRTIFEIGTFQGYTAALFAFNMPPDTVIYTLDLPPDGSESSALHTTIIDDRHIDTHGPTGEYIYSKYEVGQKVSQLYGDSAQMDFTPYHNQVDLFFIDGAHSYEYVSSDMIKAFPCMKEESVIVWHDYGRWGVTGVSRYLHQLAHEGREMYRLPGSSLAVLKV